MGSANEMGELVGGGAGGGSGREVRGEFSPRVLRELLPVD